MGGADLGSIADRKDDDEPPSAITDSGRVARDAMWAVTDCAVPVIAQSIGRRSGQASRLQHVANAGRSGSETGVHGQPDGAGIDHAFMHWRQRLRR